MTVINSKITKANNYTKLQAITLLLLPAFVQQELLQFGSCPQDRTFGITVEGFHRKDALTVIQPTADQSIKEKQTIILSLKIKTAGVISCPIH